MTSGTGLRSGSGGSGRKVLWSVGVQARWLVGERRYACSIEGWLGSTLRLAAVEHSICAANGPWMRSGCRAEIEVAVPIGGKLLPEGGCKPKGGVHRTSGVSEARGRPALLHSGLSRDVSCEVAVPSVYPPFLVCNALASFTSLPSVRRLASQSVTTRSLALWSRPWDRICFSSIPWTCPLRLSDRLRRP